MSTDRFAQMEQDFQAAECWRRLLNETVLDGDDRPGAQLVRDAVRQFALDSLDNFLGRGPLLRKVESEQNFTDQEVEVLQMLAALSLDDVHVLRTLILNVARGQSVRRPTAPQLQQNEGYEVEEEELPPEPARRPQAQRARVAQRPGIVPARQPTLVGSAAASLSELRAAQDLQVSQSMPLGAGGGEANRGNR